MLAYSEVFVDPAYLGGKEFDPDEPLPEDFFAGMYLFKFSNLPYLLYRVQTQNVLHAHAYCIRML
jgi:hypothetical protein